MLRVLIVEDSLMDAELSARELELAGYSVEWRRVQDAAELTSAIEELEWDVVLSDFNLPGFSARAALELLKQKQPDLPFIVVSGAVGEEAAVDAMKAGADDFVMKDRLARLPSVVARSLREHEFKRREEAASKLASEAIQAREHVLAIVSHDLKNPLSAIELNLQLIDRVLATFDQSSAKDRVLQVRSYMERAQRSTRRMKRLVTDILDQSKIEAGRLVIYPEPSRAEELIAEVMEMFQPLSHQKSLTLEANLPEESTLASFDHERIFQVLTNLVGNAIKFTPEGGNVTIGLDVEANDLRFCVRDTGPGIPPEHLDKVFDRYWQAEKEAHQGSGLGLSIARGIIESHGGEIHVANAFHAGRSGCLFEFTIPRWPRFTRGMKPPKSEKKIDPKKHKILLIDDDTDLRDTLQHALSVEGYEVETASDGETALELLRHDCSPPSLVMVDYRLPKMTGCEFIEKMHALKPPLNHLPVILASADADIAEKSIQVVPEGLLHKPASLKQILNLVQQVIH